MARQIFEIGALIRGQFRRLLMELGLDFKEDKGFLDSFFVVNGELEKLQRLNMIFDKDFAKNSNPQP